jgi:hypothetical protein
MKCKKLKVLAVFKKSIFARGFSLKKAFPVLVVLFSLNLLVDRMKRMFKLFEDVLRLAKSAFFLWNWFVNFELGVILKICFRCFWFVG